MRPSDITIHEKIHTSMAHLSPSEQRLAKVLLASYPSAGLKSVAELAARAQVSGATVVRFVRHLGFDGFPAFQHSLHEEVQQRAASPLQMYESHQGDTGERAPHAALPLLEKGLRQTFERTSAEEISQVVALLTDPSRRILCTGGRFSDILAQYLRNHLHQLRERVEYVAPGEGRADLLLDIGKRDVVVMFDCRRYQPDTVRFARGCRQRGATVVLITDPWLSPVAEVSKHILMCDVEGLSLYDSFVPTMALLEWLVAEIVRTLGDTARARIEKLEQTRHEQMIFRTQPVARPD